MLGNLVEHGGRHFGGADLRCRDKQISNDRCATDFLRRKRSYLAGRHEWSSKMRLCAPPPSSKSVQHRVQNVLLQQFSGRHGLHLGDG
jgi:hypothetical protein